MYEGTYITFEKCRNANPSETVTVMVSTENAFKVNLVKFLSFQNCKLSQQKYISTSDAIELEIGELSRAKLDFSEPSRAGRLSEPS